MRFRKIFRLPARDAKAVDADFEQELAFHLEMRVRELVRQGLPPDAARAEALRRYGDVDDARRYCSVVDRKHERSRALREWLADWVYDLRFAGRQVRQRPGFAIVAVATLALGIGANTAIFSVVNHLLIAPLPYPDGDRIVMLWRGKQKTDLLITPDRAMVDGWRAARTLEPIELYDPQPFVLAGAAEPEEIAGALVTTGLTGFVGARPVIGRPFTALDGVRGAPHVALISYGLWQRRFGGDEHIVGRVAQLNDAPYTIIGVLPRDFRVPSFLNGPPIQIVAPLIAGVDTIGGFPLARLRRGVTAEAAQAELTSISDRTPKDGLSALGMTARVLRPMESLTKSVRPALLVMLGAVGLVLLIACANVANLLLARAALREREFAIRTALGAGRGRLVRQLLTESAMLAAAGGAAGLIVAWQGLRAIIAFRPESLQELEAVRLQPTVLLWTLGVTIVTGLIFGLAPALHSTAAGIGDALRAGSRAAGTTGSRRFRASLVVAEVALSVVLLVSAGLLVRSVARLASADVGFDSSNLITMRLSQPHGRRGVPDKDAAPVRAHYAQLNDDLAERVRHLPGVAGVTLASGVPPRVGIMFGQFEIDGKTIDPATAPRILSFNSVQPSYFTLLKIPMIAGRKFEPGDEARNSMIISRAMARKYWKGGSAVGARFRFSPTADWNTVVGVAGDVSSLGRNTPEGELQAYAAADTMRPDRVLIVRAIGGAASSEALVPAIRRELAALDKTVALREVQTVEKMMDAGIARPRFNMALLTVFAVMALVLAAVGLYGVISFTVSQRTREIGVRMALGAEARAVLRLVVGQGLRLTVAGVVAGLVISAAVTRVLKTMLYQIDPLDPGTFAAVALLLAAVALAASYVPARRATKVDPVAALRAD